MPIGHNPEQAVKDIVSNDRYKDLRDRFDKTFSMYRLDKENYVIPAEEGEWEQYIPTHARTEGNKLTEILSFAKRVIKIPIFDEREKGRKDISGTEHCGIGMLKLADDINDGVPDSPPIQNQLAFFRVMRGWGAMRFIITEDEDGDIVPDLAIWDVRNTYWQTSGRRTTKCCYVRWVTEEDVKSEYPSWTSNGGFINLTGDTVQYESVSGKSLVPIYDIWDCSDEDKPAENGIIAGSEWVKEPEPVKLNKQTIDFLPIRIKAGRSAPLISDVHSDNVKFVGDDYLSGRRVSLPNLARIMSYKYEQAGKEAKSPNLFSYSSDLSDLKKEIDEQKIDPDVKGTSIFLDESKGEKYLGKLEPGGTRQIDSTWQVVEGEVAREGLSQIAYGVVNQTQTAQGIDILGHATMDTIKPFKMGLEQDLAWIATQMVRQYKLGNYEEREFNGYDDKNNPFNTKVKPKDIVERPFTCELKFDLMRDRAAEIGMAATLVNSGLTSSQTALDITNLVEDTDLENDKKAKEHARSLLGIGDSEALVEYVEDFVDTEDPGKQFVLAMAVERWRQTMMTPPQNVGGGVPVNMNRGNGGRMVSPQATTMGAMAGRTTPEVPQEVRERARLKSLNLV